MHETFVLSGEIVSLFLDYVFLENGSCPLKTGPCHVLVFKRALGVGWWQHQICIHQKFRPHVQKKKVNETIVTQNCSCRFMSNG